MTDAVLRYFALKNASKVTSKVPKIADANITSLDQALSIWYDEAESLVRYARKNATRYSPQPRDALNIFLRSETHHGCEVWRATLQVWSGRHRCLIPRAEGLPSGSREEALMSLLAACNDKGLGCRRDASRSKHHWRWR